MLGLNLHQRKPSLHQASLRAEQRWGRMQHDELCTFLNLNSLYIWMSYRYVLCSPQGVYALKASCTALYRVGIQHCWSWTACVCGCHSSKCCGLRRGQKLSTVAVRPCI